MSNVMVPAPPPPPLRTYVINFDGSGTNLQSFHRYLTDSREIARFWNYIPMSYFVKSYLNAATLQDRVGAFVPFGHFIVAEVNSLNINGRLPPAAWDWFSDQSQPGGLAEALARYNVPGPK